MAHSAFDRRLEDVVESTPKCHREMASKWVAGETGSWGFLAGQAVLALRRKMGRNLTEHERREVWRRLWERLIEMRGAGTADFDREVPGPS
ncbi:MAG: hypothetical protein IH860_06025 [Chloroflexi bacterium]|nr:hypothetical protein [Chloroflexota bacterium]